MSDLSIHIDTIVSCEICKVAIEYFANGTAEELLARSVGNAITFEDAATEYFDQKGWERDVNGDWTCPDHTSQQMRRAA